MNKEFNFAPYNIADEIEIYWEGFYDEYSDDYDLPEELSSRRIKKIEKLLCAHPDRNQIYTDLKNWFDNLQEREDVMSDTLDFALQDIFRLMFKVVPEQDRE